MYVSPPAVVPVVAPQRNFTNGPLLALCCLMFILFLIAATIVLALIPIYLPAKNANLNNNSPSYYFLLTPNGTAIPYNGPLTQPALTQIANAIAVQLGFPAGSLVLDSATVTTIQGRRKRRAFGLSRIRRQSGTQQISCVGRFQRNTCRRFGNCVPKVLTFSLSITITINGVSYTITFTVQISTNSFPSPGQTSTSTTTTLTSTSQSTSAATTANLPG
jgi:hypothetical protein